MWAIELWMGDYWLEFDAVRSFELASELVDEFWEEGKVARWQLRGRGRDHDSGEHPS